MLIAGATITGFWLRYQGDELNLPQARTVAFSIAAFSQLFFSVSCRSLNYATPKLGLFTNPYILTAILVSGLLQAGAVTLPFLQPIFKTTPVGAQ